MARETAHYRMRTLVVEVLRHHPDGLTSTGVLAELEARGEEGLSMDHVCHALAGAVRARDVRRTGPRGDYLYRLFEDAPGLELVVSKATFDALAAEGNPAEVAAAVLARWAAGRA